MQRRVAAIYFVFFLVVGASAYSVIALAEEPGIQVSGDSYEQGDELTVDGRTYRVAAIEAQESGGGGGHGGGGGGTTVTGALEWTNESAQFSATIGNNSTVRPADAAWGQQGRYTATLSNGSTVTFNGSDHQVVIHPSATNFSLVQGGNTSTTVAANETLAYQGNSTTVASVTGDEVTLVWGDRYRVLTPNASNPQTFSATQEFNVSQRLNADPAVENRTVTRDDGERYVIYKSNGTTQPLSEYLPEPETVEFSQGDSLTWKGNETTVANVTQSEVVLEWTAQKTNTIELEEGTNVTLNGQQYVATFPSEQSVKLSSDVGGYQDEIGRQDYFKERMNGLWGVVILSGMAAVLILALAYMPVRG